MSGGVKIFIGQIPKSFTEDDLREMFADFVDSIEEIKVIRNKATQEPQGCAFITMTNPDVAEKSIQQLHNSKKFPGVSNFLQVKYADSEQEKLSTKLFVGMLPKEYNEDDVRKLFSDYGDVDEICILRGPNNQSKSCGFIKFQSRESCLNAISSLNGIRIPPSPHNLVVKFADTEKDRKNKQKMQQQQHQQYSQQLAVAASVSLPKINPSKGQKMDLSSHYNMGGFGMNSPPPSLLGNHPSSGGVGGGLLGDGSSSHLFSTMPQFDPMGGMGMGMMGGMNGGMGMGMGSMGGMGGMGMGMMGGMGGMGMMGGGSPMGGMGGMGMGGMGMGGPGMGNGSSPGNMSMGGPGSMGMGGPGNGPNMGGMGMGMGMGMGGMGGMGGPGPMGNGGGGPGPMGNGGGGPSGKFNGRGGNNGNNGNNNNNNYYGGNGGGGGNNGNNGNNNNNYNNGPQGGGGGGNQKKNQSVGPSGSNLFVYNIPNFYTDVELSVLFDPFGAVISSKVFIDKNTGTSKGFGFVSFDNPNSATTAITNLNGMMLNGKKLKVTVKNSNSNPY
ncbi:hypothetical protein DFA_07315 [Cavenderia fasciculata]|uniref:RRM domain-containing protein n=1 Tax=Cavenderia fasciculata TaxID=261658 RepID=F4PW31_CACFS|nr:uncharacterized protein DFA_07315 [Cavenderia fasciculata]EGG20195.1 hypothetical protein DFA_07315 [Cavenderia fasciculata]|eukprot:XP_004367178.1 hypothetical protein DFA_07315 [Cavenderia fasciculata]